MERVETLPRLPRRAVDVNKVTAGRVLVVGGSRDMVGAPALAGLGALRAGAGLVLVAIPASIQPTVAGFQQEMLTAGLPESKNGGLGSAAKDTVLSRAERHDAVVLGPGLGRAPNTLKVVRAVASHVAVPLVVDADALFAFGGALGRLAERQAPTVLTPHEGEAARLLEVGSAAIRADREAHAVDIAKQAGSVVVLKGPGTIVTDGHRVYVNASGGPALATGGTGDVLAGVAGAFLAEAGTNGMDAFESACAAVYVHGAAADLLSQTVDRGLLASDIAHAIPQAVAQIVGPGS